MAAATMAAGRGLRKKLVVLAHRTEVAVHGFEGGHPAWLRAGDPGPGPSKGMRGGSRHVVTHALVEP